MKSTQISLLAEIRTRAKAYAQSIWGNYKETQTKQKAASILHATEAYYAGALHEINALRLLAKSIIDADPNVSAASLLRRICSEYDD
jgi:hypothetical protein